MGKLSRSIFREAAVSALLGTVLFTFVLFLQRLEGFFSILVRSSAPAATVGKLFALVIPRTLPFTVPLGVLVGILIALSRMSSDGEITAMRAAGVPGRRVAPPILFLAALALVLTAACSLWLAPLSIWRTYQILNKLIAVQLTAEVQPRIFEEQFPNTILYVNDVIPGAVNRWRGVFLADLTPPAQRKDEGHERDDSPAITVASEAIATADVPRNRIQLSLQNVSTLEVGKEAVQYFRTTFPHGEQILEATRPNEVRPRAFTEMDTGPLYRAAYRDPSLEPARKLEAQIELQQRLALPPACVLLALIGIPLGLSSRKGGKSAAFVLTALLALLYYMGLISLIGLAKQRTLPVALAVWTPNAVFALLGIIFLLRLERPGDRDFIGDVRGAITSALTRLRGALPSAPSGLALVPGSRAVPLLPQIIDVYILTSFLFYFAVLLVSCVAMTEVFTFFELLSDIIKNHIAMSRVLTYLLFLTPKLIYDSTPVSVLVAVLITFGISTKHNEVTAFKACGVSLYRLAVPVLIASSVLSAALFAFDHYYVPDANRKQDAIRNEIKGRPVQTYLRPDRKWIFGRESRIYYYKYFDPAEKVMVGVNVYELDPSPFRIKHHISAEKARWEPLLHTWAFQNGWSRSLEGGTKERFLNFTGGTATFPELDEPPDYFLKEVVQDKQMNFRQLASYIQELRQSGLDTVKLQVQFYKKFSVPLFALIMSLIAVPFAFIAGNRGAMAGVGVSFAIAIAYWATGQLFEQVGSVNLLPASLAAWSPDALFTLTGLYFFSRIRT